MTSPNELQRMLQQLEHKLDQEAVLFQTKQAAQDSLEREINDIKKEIPLLERGLQDKKHRLLNATSELSRVKSELQRIKTEQTKMLADFERMKTQLSSLAQTTKRAA